MLLSQRIQETAAQLRKDALFLRDFKDHRSVELYVQGLPMEIKSGVGLTAKLDRLTLVGLGENHKVVMPLPVLMRHLDLEGHKGASSLLLYFRETSKISIAQLSERREWRGLERFHDFQPFTITFFDEALERDVVIKA